MSRVFFLFAIVLLTLAAPGGPILYEAIERRYCRLDIP